MAVRIDGVRLFDAVQATWNLLERSCGEALAEAHDGGMGVVIKEGLANGRLTARNTEVDFSAKREALTRLAARLGVGSDAVALAAILARPWVDAVLSGAATAEQVRENARALDVTWDEEAELALSALAEPAEEYWSRRGRMAWN